jgi:hypothetical protein
MVGTVRVCHDNFQLSIPSKLRLCDAGGKVLGNYSLIADDCRCHYFVDIERDARYASTPSAFAPYSVLRFVVICSASREIVQDSTGNMSIMLSRGEANAIAQCVTWRLPKRDDED